MITVLLAAGVGTFAGFCLGALFVFWGGMRR